ncbi:hypothetical protein HN51_036937 [Arachis hypogaea]
MYGHRHRYHRGGKTLVALQADSRYTLGIKMQQARCNKIFRGKETSISADCSVFLHVSLLRIRSKSSSLADSFVGEQPLHSCRKIFSNLS